MQENYSELQKDCNTDNSMKTETSR